MLSRVMLASTRSALCISDKLNQHVVDQIATLPGFYDLNHMFESVKAGQNVLTRPAKVMLVRLQW